MSAEEPSSPTEASLVEASLHDDDTNDGVPTESDVSTNPPQPRPDAGPQKNTNSMLDHVDIEGQWKTMDVKGGGFSERPDPFKNSKWAIIWNTSTTVIGGCAYVLCNPLKLLQTIVRQDPSDIEHNLTKDSTFWEHCQELTQLSRLLVVVLAVAALTAFATLEPKYLVMAACVQALFKLYLVFWRHHRLDLSLNMAIQYFAAGFGAAFLLNIIAFLFLTLFFLGLLFGKIEQKWVEFIAAIPGVTAFRSFVLAGLLQEYLKYWIFVSSQKNRKPRLATATEASEALVGSDDDGGDAETSTLVRTGSAITCATVAIAVGFAWMKSFARLLWFPAGTIPSFEYAALYYLGAFLEAIFGGIQSIGICERDLEGHQTQNSVVSILMPAVLFHGTYHFFQFQSTPSSLYAAAATAFIATVYYTYLARKQRIRLRGQSNGKEDYKTGSVDEEWDAAEGEDTSES